MREIILHYLLWTWAISIAFNYGSLLFIAALAWWCDDDEYPMARFVQGMKQINLHLAFIIPAPLASLLVLWLLPKGIGMAIKQRRINKRKAQ